MLAGDHSLQHYTVNRTRLIIHTYTHHPTTLSQTRGMWKTAQL